MEIPPETDNYIKESIEMSLGLPISEKNMQLKIMALEETRHRLQSQIFQLEDRFLRAKVWSKVLSLFFSLIFLFTCKFTSNFRDARSGHQLFLSASIKSSYTVKRYLSYTAMTSFVSFLPEKAILASIKSWIITLSFSCTLWKQYRTKVLKNVPHQFNI